VVQRRSGCRMASMRPARVMWGWSQSETVELLMEESTKAQANGKGYAELTVRNAALAVERRRQQPKEKRSVADDATQVAQRGRSVTSRTPASASRARWADEGKAGWSDICGAPMRER
jgi:hypothetical protein